MAEEDAGNAMPTAVPVAAVDPGPQPAPSRYEMPTASDAAQSITMAIARLVVAYDLEMTGMNALQSGRPVGFLLTFWTNGIYALAGPMVTMLTMALWRDTPLAVRQMIQLGRGNQTTGAGAEGEAWGSYLAVYFVLVLFDIFNTWLISGTRVA